MNMECPRVADRQSQQLDVESSVTGMEAGESKKHISTNMELQRVADRQSQQLDVESSATGMEKSSAPGSAVLGHGKVGRLNITNVNNNYYCLPGSPARKGHSFDSANADVPVDNPHWEFKEPGVSESIEEITESSPERVENTSSTSDTTTAECAQLKPETAKGFFVQSLGNSKPFPKMPPKDTRIFGDEHSLCDRPIDHGQSQVDGHTVVEMPNYPAQAAEQAAANNPAGFSGQGLSCRGGTVSWDTLGKSYALSVTGHKFDAQIETLVEMTKLLERKGFTICPFKDIKNFILQGSPFSPPDRKICYTYDDLSIFWCIKNKNAVSDFLKAVKEKRGKNTLFLFASLEWDLHRMKQNFPSFPEKSVNISSENTECLSHVEKVETMDRFKATREIKWEIKQKISKATCDFSFEFLCKNFDSSLHKNPEEYFQNPVSVTEDIAKSILDDQPLETHLVFLSVLLGMDLSDKTIAENSFLTKCFGDHLAKLLSNQHALYEVVKQFQDRIISTPEGRTTFRNNTWLIGFYRALVQVYPSLDLYIAERASTPLCIKGWSTKDMVLAFVGGVVVTLVCVAGIYLIIKAGGIVAVLRISIDIIQHGLTLFSKKIQLVPALGV